uniref:Uncharacterized protein n=1 Tax=Arundo donax TaxID=35708 RepID=A0A0A9C0J4_ARUDO
MCPEIQDESDFSGIPFDFLEVPQMLDSYRKSERDMQICTGVSICIYYLVGGSTEQPSYLLGDDCL